MKIDEMKAGKLQYSFNREAAKMLALPTGKIGKCRYITYEVIPPCDQSRIIEQAKFIYSPLGKVFEKQTRAMKN